MWEADQLLIFSLGFPLTYLTHLKRAQEVSCAAMTGKPVSTRFGSGAVTSSGAVASPGGRGNLSIVTSQKRNRGGEMTILTIRVVVFFFKKSSTSEPN